MDYIGFDGNTFKKVRGKKRIFLLKYNCVILKKNNNQYYFKIVGKLPKQLILGINEYDNEYFIATLLDNKSGYMILNEKKEYVSYNNNHIYGDYHYHYLFEEKGRKIIKYKGKLLNQNLLFQNGNLSICKKSLFKDFEKNLFVKTIIISRSGYKIK